MREPGPLRLAAMDEEDLAVLSAHVQDSIVRVGDMAWLPEARRFAMLLSRFDWAAAEGGERLRRRCALRIDCVRAVRQRDLPQLEPDTALNLLAMTFSPGQAPSGEVRLEFSGGAGVRLEVECIEAALRDLDEEWPARFKPRHRA